MNENNIAVANEEIEIYEQAVLSQIAILKKNVPNTLWHYTSGEGLIGIITTGNLWATQVACLNDSKELVYAVDLLRDELVRHRIENISPDFPGKSRFLSILLDGLGVHSAAPSEWFVASFSERANDLSQWRGYGGGEGGYAIGFDGARLPMAATNASAMLVPVCYDVKIQKEIAIFAAHKTVEFFRIGLKARGSDALVE